MTQVKIIVKQEAPREIKGTSAKNGKPYAFRAQAAGLPDNTGEYLTPFDLTTNLDVEPYKPGVYTIDMARSVYVRNGRMEFRPVLVPVEQK